MAVITIPRVLREKLGEDGADTLVELLNLANQKVKEDVIELSAEKFERRLTEEMAKVNQRITEDIAQFRGEVKEDIAQLRSVDLANLDKRITDEVAKLDKRITEEMAKVNQRITDEVANLRGEIKENTVTLIKWQVGMFVTTVILILGLYATIIFK
jgi:gas vesicle protein